MAYYYVNTNAQSNGDHEVHKEGCNYMPDNKKYLGLFSSCGEAVAESKKKHYSKSDGCAHCSPECHKS